MDDMLMPNTDRASLKKVLSPPYISILLIILISIVLVAPTLVRGMPVGTDSYFYMQHAYNPQPGYPPIAFYVLPTIPLILIVISMITIFDILREKFGAPWYTTALLLAAPGFIMRMNLIEDDLLGVVLGLLFILFYVHAYKEKSLKHWYIATGILCIGLLTWRGILMFFGPVMIHQIGLHTNRYLKWLPMLTPPLFTKPDVIVGEQALGVPFFPLMCMGTAMGLLNWKRANSFVWGWAMWFLAFGMLQVKWLWLCVFPLALLTGDYCSRMPWDKVQNFLIVAVGLGLVAGAMLTLSTQPHDYHLADLKEVISITGSEEICNEWWLGHWISYLGGTPVYSPEYPRPYRYTPCNDSVKWHLTNWSLPQYTLVKNYNWTKLYYTPTP